MEIRKSQIAGCSGVREEGGFFQIVKVKVKLAKTLSNIRRVIYFVIVFIFKKHNFSRGHFLLVWFCKKSTRFVV